ncbi:phosphodiesterase [Rhizobium sp. LjRoot254]|uniref:phosphodiesterase n=1 Tax=Rhizobium sp. LjRoot254 TaxID=3342297 RepID=UPI003ED02C83
MKLVHISDIHINPEPILGIDPVANFKACIDHVAEFQPDADRVVITGDLTHHGRRESYELLRGMLDQSALKNDLAPRLLIGNHDDRDTFRAVFPEAAADHNGHVQWYEDVAAGRFVYLDTSEKGTDAGHYGEERRAWLAHVLDLAREDGVPAWIFMHHNPAAVHVANADQIGLVDEAAFQALVSDYRDVVRHIFFGHCHYTLSGMIDGIPFSAPRSTCHTCWPDFSGIANRMGYGDLVPNYNVCMLNERSTVIHSVDFLDQHKVKWRMD